MLLPGSERIFSRSRIRTPLGKWDSPKSPQGYCRAVADPDFQIRGGGGAVSNAIFLRASVWTKYNGGPSVDPPLIGKENGFQEKDDRSSDTGWSQKRGGNAGWGHLQAPPPPPPGASLQTLSYLPYFISSTLANKSNISFTHINDNKNNKLYLDLTYK